MIKDARTASIAAEGSRYRFGRAVDWREDDASLDALGASLESFGVLSPLVVDGSMELVDGFKRLAWARMKRVETVPVIELPDGAAPEDILPIVLNETAKEAQASPASKARFIAFAKKAGAGDEVVRNSIMPILGLEPSGKLMRRLEAVSRLPEEVLGFLDEKRFSLKQCYSLTMYPSDLLDLVFSWREKLSLTASLLEEFLESLKDYLGASGLSPRDLPDDGEIAAILYSDTSAHERTRRLRERIRRLRYPTITEVNRDLEKIKKAMNLPRNVDVRWDASLERKEARVTIIARKTEEWEEAMEKLRSGGLSDGIKSILDRL